MLLFFAFFELFNMSLRLQAEPTPNSLETFLSKLGGQILQSLECLEKKSKGCGCQHFDIYKNSITGQEFVVITCHHLFRLLYMFQ